MDISNKLRLLGCITILTFTGNTPHSSLAQSKVCSNGSLLCCNAVVEANDPTVQQLAALLGIILELVA